MKKGYPNGKKNQLRKENEELKKKINQDYGGAYRENPEKSTLPPEIENDFLNHIMAFEEAFENRKMTTVYEFLGKPDYRKIEELKEDKIAEELDRLYDVMQKNQMQLDTICEVSNHELYRFITEELFWEEMDDMRIPGMTSHFTYEEFHPNHEYDIKEHIDMFISSYLNKDSDFYLDMLTSKARKQDWHHHFRDTFSSFENDKFEITKIDFDVETENAEVIFRCEIKAKVENSGDVFLFDGAGKIDLNYEYDYWSIQSIEFPKPV